MNKIQENKNAKVLRILNGISYFCDLKIFYGSAHARRFTEHGNKIAAEEEVQSEKEMLQVLQNVKVIHGAHVSV